MPLEFGKKAGYGIGAGSEYHLSRGVRLLAGINYLHKVSYTDEYDAYKHHPDTPPQPPPGWIIVGTGYYNYVPLEIRIRQLNIPLSVSIKLAESKKIKTRFNLLAGINVGFNRKEYLYRFDTSVFYINSPADRTVERFWRKGMHLGFEFETRFNNYFLYASTQVAWNSEIISYDYNYLPVMLRSSLGLRYIIKDKQWAVREEKEPIRKPRKKIFSAEKIERLDSAKLRRENDKTAHRNYWAIQSSFSSIHGNRAQAFGAYIYKRNYRRRSSSPGIGIVYHSIPASSYFPASETGFVLLEAFNSFNFQGMHLSYRLMPIGGIGFNSRSIFWGSAGLMTGVGLSVWRFDANFDVGIYNLKPAMRFGLAYVMSDNKHLAVRNPWNSIRKAQKKPANDTTQTALDREFSKLAEKKKKDKEEHPGFHGIRISRFLGSYYDADGFALTYFRRNYRILSISPLAGIAYSKYSRYSYKIPYGYKTTRDFILDAGAMLNLQMKFLHFRITASLNQAIHKGGGELTGGLMLGAGFSIWRLEANFESGIYHYSDSRISLAYVFSNNKELKVRKALFTK